MFPVFLKGRERGAVQLPVGGPQSVDKILFPNTTTCPGAHELVRAAVLVIELVLVRQ